MHRVEELKEKLLEELAQYSENGKFSKEDAENIKNLSGSIDHICNIIMAYEDEEGYSERGGNYGGGMSYARDGRGGSRGGNRGGNSYTRGRMNARRDSRGRYSREGGYSYAEDGMHEILSDMREMMTDLPAEKQQEVRRFIDKMERM